MSLVGRVARVRSLAAQLVQECDDLSLELGQVDRLIHGDLLPPVQPPAPKPPAPELPPGPKPDTPWIEQILATCWGDRKDDEKAAAGGPGANDWGQLAYGWAPKPGPRRGMEILGAALPARIAQGTVARVRLHGMPSQHAIEIPVIDVGPLNTDDPYWRTGTRPRTDVGLDLTPLAWARLTGGSPESAWDRAPSGLVDIQVIEPGVPAAAGSAGEIARIALEHVGLPFGYEPDTDGGRWGCANVVSHILRDAGILSELVLTVDGVVEALRERGWRSVEPPYEDGDVVAWPKGPSGHKHVGIVVRQDDLRTVNNSSEKREVVLDALTRHGEVESVWRRP